MLLGHIKVSGLLSFGPTGVDLELRNLNVLIGPNGSGKSNLIEVIALLRAASQNLPAPVKEMGGVREWIWKGTPSPNEALIEVLVVYPHGRQNLRHVLAIADHGGRFEVTDERIENERPYDGKKHPFYFYNFRRGNPSLNERTIIRHNPKKADEFEERKLLRTSVRPEESILSQVKDPDRYPVMTHLVEKYSSIRLFRNWSFGPAATLRREQSAHGRNDFLEDGGENLALVLSRIRNRAHKSLLDALKKLYDGIEDVIFEIDGGSVQMFIAEAGGRHIPATRLSDGTLRYLCLLAILLHPDPPPLVVIEEPELGLHPDILPFLAELLKTASERMQLIVTTHSRLLVDAVGEQPECVVVCGKENGQTVMQRLDAEHLKGWLESYSLGELWSRGELGGNRW